MKKSHCKAFLVLLSATLSMLFSTGCTAVQVRDRTYLQALELHTAENIEESDAAYRVGVHDFREAETGAAAVCSGETLTEALTQAAVETGGELFLGHLELLAYENGADAANFSQWMKTYQLSASCFILGLPDGDNLTEIDTSRLAEQLRYAAENAG